MMRKTRQVDVIAACKQMRADDRELIREITESVQEHEHPRRTRAVRQQDGAPTRDDDAVVRRLTTRDHRAGAVVARRRRQWSGRRVRWPSYAAKQRGRND